MTMHEYCNIGSTVTDDGQAIIMICASSSNRNFIGRQGSATGRTVLMSPLMVVAAAITGTVADVRDICDVENL